MEKFFFVFMLLISGCHPKSAVNITADDGGFTVEMENCSHPKQKLPLISLSIRVAGSDMESSPWCSLGRSDRKIPRIAQTWRYGKRPPGYHMEGCAPLQPNTNYEVKVFLAGNSVAFASIRIDQNGSPHRTSGACP